MLSTLEQSSLDVMYPKLKEIYDMIDGWNVANTVLDEPTAVVDFIQNKCSQSLLGKNYRITIYNDDSGIFAFIDFHKERFLELKEQIDELGIKYIVRKFPNRIEPLKIVVNLNDNYLRQIADLIELVKIR